MRANKFYLFINCIFLLFFLFSVCFFGRSLSCWFLFHARYLRNLPTFAAHKVTALFDVDALRKWWNTPWNTFASICYAKYLFTLQTNHETHITQNIRSLFFCLGFFHQRNGIIKYFCFQSFLNEHTARKSITKNLLCVYLLFFLFFFENSSAQPFSLFFRPRWITHSLVRVFVFI